MQLCFRHRVLATAGAATISLLGAVAAPASADPGPFALAGSFSATTNTADQSAESVAEIATLSKNGDTLIYTDAAAEQIGFVNVSDPAHPQPAGALPVAGEPTSVYATNKYILVVVDTSESYTDPSGTLIVLDAKTREVVTELALGGQPDSIDVTDNGKTAVVAIENQRDEDLAPEGGEEGDLPQLPAGELAIIDLNGKASKLRVEKVSLAGLPGLVAPEDPEPEYVSISPDDKTVAVTLQENNAIALVDIKSRSVLTSYTAGTVTVDGVDTVKDGVIDPTGSITEEREPDAIAWVGNEYVATANEGDWRGGSRGWTVFEAGTGQVVWDAGNTFENLAINAGRYPESRAGKKGTEPEGILSATFGGTPYLFVASERGSFVAVYDVADPAAPAFVQLLETLPGPEGLVADEKNGVLYVSSETDDPDGQRAGVQAYVFTG